MGSLKTNEKLAVPPNKELAREDVHLEVLTSWTYKERSTQQKNASDDDRKGKNTNNWSRLVRRRKRMRDTDLKSTRCLWNQSKRVAL